MTIEENILKLTEEIRKLTKVISELPIQKLNDQNLTLIPLSKWDKYYPYPSIASLRNLVFNSKKNGFDQCITRMGKKIFIDKNKFDEWLKSRPKLS